MKTLRTGLIYAATLFFISPLMAQTKNAFQYIGSDGCKKCHLTAKSGAAYKVWQKTKHANAFATLASEEAKAIGKKMGIEDPQKSDKCLECHVTAFGVAKERLGAKFSHEEGVGCEVCHGAGEKYADKAVKAGIADGSIAKASVGLIEPNEETCKSCHNEKSPTFKGFDFAEKAKEIAHPTPKS